MKLDIKAFALAGGFVAALGLLLFNGWLWAIGRPGDAPMWLSHIYRGYSLTLLGSLIGAMWAFFDGAIAGTLFAWFYDVIDARLILNHRVTH